MNVARIMLVKKAAQSILLGLLLLGLGPLSAFSAILEYEPMEEWLIEKKAGEVNEQERNERERSEKERNELKSREQKEAQARKERNRQEAVDRQARMLKKLEGEKYHVNASYAVFTHENRAFKKMADATRGFSAGVDVYKYFTLGFDTWSSDDAKLATVRSMKAQAISLLANYPHQFNEYAALTVSGGFRMESVSINYGDAVFGNNAALAAVGVKLRFSERFGFAADLGRTYGAKHTDYLITRAGFFSAF